MKRALLLLAALGGLQQAAAQAPARLRIRAVDSAGAPIPYASISVSGSDGTYSTDLSGWTVTLRVAAGPVEISGRAIGFRPGTLKLDAIAGKSTTALLRLSAAPVRLADLEVLAGPAAVRAGFYQRVRRFGGRVVTREAIERSGAIHPLNALSTTLGIKISQVPMSFDGPMLGTRGCRMGRIVIAIDGREVASSPVQMGDELYHALGLVRASELDLIEVYQRYDEVPPPYRHPGTCGALLLWTTAGINRENP